METTETQETLVIEAIQAAAVRVFSTMLDKQLTPGPLQAEQVNAAGHKGVSAQISLVGACSISSLLNCSQASACAIASAMLMAECPEVDAEVLDAMAEMANMIMGSVKTDLDAHLGTSNLSIPTVISGGDFALYNNSKRWVVLPFAMEGEPITVKLCFESAGKTSAGRYARRQSAARL